MMDYKRNIRCPKCDGKLRLENECAKAIGMFSRREFTIPNALNTPTCTQCRASYIVKVKCEGELEITFEEMGRSF